MQAPEPARNVRLRDDDVALVAAGAAVRVRGDAAAGAEEECLAGAAIGTAEQEEAEREAERSSSGGGGPSVSRGEGLSDGTHRVDEPPGLGADSLIPACTYALIVARHGHLARDLALLDAFVVDDSELMGIMGYGLTTLRTIGAGLDPSTLRRGVGVVLIAGAVIETAVGRRGRHFDSSGGGRGLRGGNRRPDGPSSSLGCCCRGRRGGPAHRPRHPR